MMKKSDWPVVPMEPVSRQDIFDSADMLYQVKWDGVRVLAYIYPDRRVRLFNRRLNERTEQYPELAESVSHLPGGTVLDGEIVALNTDGKPDFPRVLRRDLVRSAVKIRQAMYAVPICYMVFDVLWKSGRAVTAFPLHQRLKVLGELDIRAGFIHKVESVPQTGGALFEAVRAEGLEGVVAKKKNSAYLIGQKTDLWQKIKCFRNLTGVVGGYLQDDPARIRSLLVGIPEEGGLRYIGPAASGLTQKQLVQLKEIFTAIRGPCPFVNPPADGNWVLPMLRVEVRFLEYTPGGVMRAPSILGFPEG